MKGTQSNLSAFEKPYAIIIAGIQDRAADAVAEQEVSLDV